MTTVNNLLQYSYPIDKDASLSIFPYIDDWYNPHVYDVSIAVWSHDMKYPV